MVRDPDLAPGCVATLKLTHVRVVLQTIVNANSLFSGIGSYPLEGGYF
jgi:hypothetical protein